MSTAPHTKLDPPKADDPYRIGWRYVKRIGAGGREEYEQVPLTEADLLCPQEGDVVVNNDRHDQIRIYLKGVFRRGAERVPGRLVLSDHRIDYGVEGIGILG